MRNIFLSSEWKIVRGTAFVTFLQRSNEIWVVETIPTSSSKRRRGRELRRRTYLLFSIKICFLPRVCVSDRRMAKIFRFRPFEYIDTRLVSTNRPAVSSSSFIFFFFPRQRLSRELRPRSIVIRKDADRPESPASNNLLPTYDSTIDRRFWREQARTANEGKESRETSVFSFVFSYFSVDSF